MSDTENLYPQNGRLDKYPEVGSWRDGEGGKWKMDGMMNIILCF